MSKHSSGAIYLNVDNVPTKRFTSSKKSPIIAIVSSFFALMMLFLSVHPLVMNSQSTSNETASVSHTADAASLVCTSRLGIGMDSRQDWKPFIRNYPQSDAINRTWTLQEAFGRSMTFVNYEGEGVGDPIIMEEKVAPENPPGNYEAISSKLETVRTADDCLFAGGTAMVSTMTLGLANVFSSVTQMFVVFAFDSNIICEDAANPDGFCLNLLKIIGGSSGNSGDGLIGTLTSTIYLPLLVIVVAIVGFWVGYRGIVKRQFREAMFGAIWLAVSVIVGLIILLNPMLLAKAPMAVSNAVSACVIGAFNGDNCMTGASNGSGIETDTTASTSGSVCASTANDASIDISERMSMTVNSLSCSIWKAFVLEPYAQGSFGTSFASLDTRDASQPTRAVIERAGLNPETFCVSLETNASLSSFYGKEVQFKGAGNGKTVCNLLAYQMHLQTMTKDGAVATPAAGQIDERWYNVIVAAAHDDGLWNQWAPSFSGGLHTLGISGLALVTTLIGGVVLIVISFYALMYYLSSVVLMAFAPIFALIGTHPGRGKKILFGWLEKVISNVLKYLISAVFLIVAIVFYGAILGGISNIGLSLLFVIIISGALFMYRREITDMIGRVQMGGEAISSSFTDKLKERAGGVQKLGVAAVGGAVGSKLAGGTVGAGMNDGFRRELSRGGAKAVLGNTLGDVVTQTVRQENRGHVDNAQDLKQHANVAEAEAAREEKELNKIDEEFTTVADQLSMFDANLAVNSTRLAELDDLHIKFEGVEQDALREMQADDTINPFFVSAQQLANQIAGLKHDRALAVAAGRTDEVEKIDATIGTLALQRQDAMSRVSSDELKAGRSRYSDLVSEKMEREGFTYTFRDETERTELASERVTAADTRERLADRQDELANRYNESAGTAIADRVTADALREADIKRQPGEKITVKDVNETRSRAAELGAEKAAEQFTPKPTAARGTIDEIVARTPTKQDSTIGSRRASDVDGRGPERINEGTRTTRPFDEDGDEGPRNDPPTGGSRPPKGDKPSGGSGGAGLPTEPIGSPNRRGANDSEPLTQREARREETRQDSSRNDQRQEAQMSNPIAQSNRSPQGLPQQPADAPRGPVAPPTPVTPVAPQPVQQPQQAPQQSPQQASRRDPAPASAPPVQQSTQPSTPPVQQQPVQTPLQEVPQQAPQTPREQSRQTQPQQPAQPSAAPVQQPVQQPQAQASRQDAPREQQTRQAPAPAPQPVQPSPAPTQQQAPAQPQRTTETAAPVAQPVRQEHVQRPSTPAAPAPPQASTPVQQPVPQARTSEPTPAPSRSEPKAAPAAPAQKPAPAPSPAPQPVRPEPTASTRQKASESKPTAQPKTQTKASSPEPKQSKKPEATKQRAEKPQQESKQEKRSFRNEPAADNRNKIPEIKLPKAPERAPQSQDKKGPSGLPKMPFNRPKN